MIACRLRVVSYTLHLQQLFTGFSELQRRGLIALEVTRGPGPSGKFGTSPYLLAQIDGGPRLVYDCADGGMIQPDYLRDCDFYFKRSCPKQLFAGDKVQPLGLNYGVFGPHRISPWMAAGWSFRDRLAGLVWNSRWLCGLLDRTSIKDQYVEDFEYYPVIAPGRPKVLFSARLWDPAIISDIPKETLDSLNRMRIDCVRACRRKYGEDFVGGLSDNSFARRLCPDLILPCSRTNQKAYLAEMRTAAVCVASTGLHDSIGYKFAEYLAAGRAIVTEPLNFRVTGDLQPGRNYLEFTSVEGLLGSIDSLLESRERRSAMMLANHQYYHSYVRPDMLVLHSLLRCLRPGNEAESGPAHPRNVR